MILSIPKFLCCLYCNCMRDKKFKAYALLVKMSSNKISKDLDLVRLIRRLRMHGVGLYHSLNL